MSGEEPVEGAPDSGEGGEQVIGSRLLARLPRRFRWTLHNVIAHPISEALYQIGFGRYGDKLHDATIPEHRAGTGRG